MKFIRTKIHDVVIVEPKISGDDRGYFIESFRKDQLENFLGYKINFCQDNESKSTKGVLRGLHYQLPPFAQTKLVRVIKGAVLDVVVDIRYDSPTFGEHVSVELTGENKKQILVPRGFAHGFVVLSEEATFAYKVDNYYNFESERGFSFDDPKLNIDWKIKTEKLNLSLKDTNQPLFIEAEYFKSTNKLYE
jgi:dTDP-4-dehydrorhamnose 3,5-epimerase